MSRSKKIDSGLNFLEEISDIDISECYQRDFSKFPISTVSRDRVVGLLDLTSLENTDTLLSIENLYLKGFNPNHFYKNLLQYSVDESNQIEISTNTHVAGICSFSNNLDLALSRRDELLSSVKNAPKIVSVGGFFPYGKASIKAKLYEINEIISKNIDEIDIVLDQGLVNSREYSVLFDEITQISNLLKSAERKIILKVILESGEINDKRILAEVAYISLYAGADFLKTSTGKLPKMANLNDFSLMALIAARFKEINSTTVGLKVSGGVKDIVTASHYIEIYEKNLLETADSSNFRIGSSSLLDNIFNQINVDVESNYPPIIY